MELGYRHVDVPYWTGRGGITPPGGNTGSPARFVCSMALRRGPATWQELTPPVATEQRLVPGFSQGPSGDVVFSDGQALAPRKTYGRRSEFDPGAARSLVPGELWQCPRVLT